MEFLFLVCYDMHFSLYCPWLETFCTLVFRTNSVALSKQKLISVLSVPEKNKKEENLIL
jgi:hypothetical protein